MSSLHQWHFLFLALWAGLVLAEVVIELLPRKFPTLRRAAVKYHAWLDMCVEIPLLLGVLITGTALSLRHGLTPDLWLKLALGLLAVSANIVCVGLVLRREKLEQAGVENTRYDTWVMATAYSGIPCALGALYLGGQRVGWW